jgi:hypothetical protein
MRKSVFGLAVAGATLAGAIGSAGPASAVNYVYDDVTYDVTTYTGTWNDLSAILTGPDNVLWQTQSPALAAGLAGVVKDSEGMFSSNQQGWISNGPLFAHRFNYLNNTLIDIMAYGTVYGGGNVLTTLLLSTSVDRYDSREEVWATAKATAVPWETDALPVIGSTILFAGGLWAKNKFAKPLKK